MTMKTALSLIAAAVALMAGQAYAQTDRAAVKAEAAAANKKGELKPGEAGTPVAKPDPKAAPKRTDVKAEAAASEKKGEQKAGEAAPGGTKAEMKSDKKRADVKEETKAAVKKGETPKAGEAVKQ